MKKVFYIAVAGALAVIASCNKNSSQDMPTNQGIRFDASVGAMSKATETSFEQNDAISVFAIKKSATNTTGKIENSNYADNIKYQWDGGIFSSKSPIMYDDNNTELFFTAIYPYSPNYSNSFKFSVANDQSTHEGYSSSDLMVARTEATQEDKPCLRFNHGLCQIVFNIKYTGTYPADEVRLTLKNVNTSVSVNLNENTFTGLSSKGSIKMCADGKDCFKAITVPQTMAANVDFVEVSIGNTVTSFYFTSNTTWKSGKHYEYNLTIDNNHEITFESLINPWDDPDLDVILTSEQIATIQKYMPIYEGSNPPIINGTYKFGPSLIYDSSEQFNVGHAFLAEYLDFSNQDNKSLTIKFKSVTLSNEGECVSYSEAERSVITGYDNFFTLYFTTKGQTNGVVTRTISIYSGEKSASGIVGLYYAFTMLYKGDDPENLVVDEGAMRIFDNYYDIAAYSSWPTYTKSGPSILNQEGISSVFANRK